ncbi:TonB-dependent receptor [Microbulbifer taiwanensis]|uniref:TonB-dependent receptor n=1 Tax=Microbulbifer taiwanensis TaxID=986746 RepID=A0ABW1YPU8_9GAMM|nr:TonB-dependent receptor [Microbulbifer taiwanensis]
MNSRHWAILSLATLVILSEGVLAACPKSGVRLPAGNLSRALISMGRQCKISVLVQTTSATSYTLPEQILDSEDGEFEPALQQLLQDSPFTYERVGPSAVAVLPRKIEAEEAAQPLPAHTEEITVTGRSLTGSHLRHLQLDSYAPIDVLAQPELEITGAQTIAELLKFLPAVSGNSTSTSVSNGGDGTATVTLRGLPASNTLVLINGRRIVNNGFGGEAADLNSIPLSAVDRIEILKDGASAVYGSDAIAGVVNIILRRDFEGLSVNSYYGRAQRGDQQTESHHITWGKSTERGHLMLSLAHYSQGALMSRDRQLSATSDNRARGGTDLRSSASPSAYIALDDGQEIVTNSASGGYREWTQADRYDYREYTSAVVPSQRQSAYLEGNLDLGENTLLFAELMGIRTAAKTTMAPTPVFTRFDNGDLAIAADNIHNPFEQEIVDVRKRVLELGPRLQKNRTDTWRLNSGVKGMWDSWQWELTAALHYTRATEKLNNLIDPWALSMGLRDPVTCDGQSDCVAINLLGPSGSIDAEQVEFIRGESLVDGTTRMTSLTYVVNGALGSNGAGNILAAAGLEARREAIDFRSNDAMGLSFIGGSASGSAVGQRMIGEAFAEISVPLAEDKFWLDGALRFSEYSDFGNTGNPKVALRWRPSPSLMLRASYATGFKAPTLIDMNQTGYQSQEYLFDPCTSRDAPTLPGCRGQADDARIQYLTEFGGNRDLQPETSDNRSLGLVWTPQQLKGFSATLDLYDIRQNDVIDTSPQYLIDRNAHSGLFTHRVLRDESGDITKILATRLNIGAREVRGFDLAMRYEHISEDIGQLRWSLNSSHMQRYLNQAAPGSPVEDLAGTFVDAASGGAGSLPQWKANTGVYWHKGRWEGGYTVHFVSELEESFTLDETRVTREISNWSTHDLQLAYSLPLGLRFAVGIDNLLDREPPFAATAFNDNFDGRTYDLSGRYWYTTLAYNL